MADDLDFFDEVDTQQTLPEKLVSVRFVTKIEDPALKVPLTAIAVPATSARYALSELINHLLDLKPPKMFDFLTTGNVLLRDTIAEYMQRKNLPLAEYVLELEYVEILPKPDLKKGIDAEDWISCLVGGLEVDGLKGKAMPLFFSGSYDHRLRLWSSEGQCLLSFTPHSSPISALASTRHQTPQSKLSVITGAKDSSIKAWEVDGANNTYNETAETFVGHTDAITSIAIDPSVKDSNSLLRFCSSSWDKTILLWQPYHDYIEETDSKDGSNKRRRIQTENHAPKQQLRGHTQVVQKVEWIDSFSVVSGSSDHTLRIWDVASGVSTSIMYGNEVVTGLSHSKNNGLVASSHPDRIVRLWDPRSQEKEFIKKKLRSHTKWVTDVCWHPESPNLLLSASHDKTVKVWDIRSDFALHTLTSHTDKVLCVDWNGSSSFLTGSADSRIYIHSLASGSLKRQ
jgi:ribosome biogenesis protein YTM1